MRKKKGRLARFLQNKKADGKKMVLNHIRLGKDKKMGKGFFNFKSEISRIGVIINFFLILFYGVISCGGEAEISDLAMDGAASKEAGDFRSDDDDYEGEGEASDDDYDGDATADDDVADDDDTGSDYLPPEIEEQYIENAPQASEKFVYVLNETLGTVARIDPQTLSVNSISVGTGAKALTTLPDSDAAVVSVTSRKSLALIESAGGSDKVTVIPLSEPYTDIVVSPDGHFVIAYFNLGAGVEVPSNLSENNYAKIAIINLHLLRNEGKSPKEVVFEKPVSFRTTNVFFSEDSTRAFIVTKSDVALVDLTKLAESSLLPRIGFASALYEDVSTREVLLSPDGNFLFVRNFADNRILVLDTVTKERSYITLSGVASDMDISPTGEYLLVVQRAAKRLAIVPLPEGVVDEGEIKIIELGNVLVGQAKISPTENLAALFTTAEYREELAIIDLTTGEYALYGSSDGLVKAVKSVEFSPDGKRLVLFHYKRPATLSYTFCDIQTAPCSSSTECVVISGTQGVCLKTCDPTKEDPGCASYYQCEAKAEKSGYCVRNGDTLDNIEVDPYEIKVNQSEGYSIFNIEMPFFWLKLLEKEVTTYAFTPSSNYAGFVISAVSTSGTRVERNILQVAELNSMIVSQDVQLPSPAVFAGAFPESEMLFVLQEHPLGRITFVNVETTDVRTITGFELNSEIE
ncbi:MAG: hypothetical protein Kow0090_12280 [Myxococcota bacterium]